MTRKTFAVVYESLPGNGWLSRAEAELLWEWVHKTEGAILEVGSFKGRSTCLLGATGRKVYAVDPFEGFDSNDPSGVTIYRELCANLDGRRLSNVIVQPSRIENWLPKPCGFAYLDGPHTYHGTLDQVEKALACGVSVIAVHDVNDDGEGYEIKMAAVETLGAWDDRVERLAVWKVKP